MSAAQRLWRILGLAIKEVSVSLSPARSMKQLLTQPLRLPRWHPFTPEAGDPAIFGFNNERAEIVREVVGRTLGRYVEASRPLEFVLNEAAHEEVKRLEYQRDGESATHLGFWKGLVRSVGRMSDEEKRATLLQVAERMAWDIAGNFDPRVYQFAARAVPRVLTGVMKPSALPSDLLALNRDINTVDRLLETDGDIDRLRRLAKIGTLVYVPTHSSNLDSIALGYCLFRSDLPPVVYGAGKNLFTNPIISFFMHNLGAYQLDRRIRATLYKDVLKTYSCVMIERGYHSLFFPGGTRSRSGMVERRLKLGLAGTAVEAFARNQTRGNPRPVWFVPTTINYGLVLEAESLIGDWLKEEGKARYILNEEDEFSQIDRWLAFFRRLSNMETACVIRFGRPLDPFGNEIDDSGRSITPDGRTIDPGTYVMSGGKPTLDARRDAEYTREMGDLLKEHYEHETVLMPSQIVAHVLFRRLVRSTPGGDLFSRLRYKSEISIPRHELDREVGAARDRLLELRAKGDVHVAERSLHEHPARVIDRVFNAWSGYHRRPMVALSDGKVTLEDPALILYYQNRLNAYAERIADDGDREAAQEIATMGER